MEGQPFLNHPRAAARAVRFGGRWWQIDLEWYIIQGLKGLKLERRCPDKHEGSDARSATGNLRYNELRKNSFSKGIAIQANALASDLA